MQAYLSQPRGSGTGTLLDQDAILTFKSAVHFEAITDNNRQNPPKIITVCTEETTKRIIRWKIIKILPNKPSLAC